MDISKLPKYAQEYIRSLERSQSENHVSNCHFQTVGVQHDEHSADAIASVASAIEANAKATEANARAAEKLSSALSGGDVNTGPALMIGNPDSRC